MFFSEESGSAYTFTARASDDGFSAGPVLLGTPFAFLFFVSLGAALFPGNRDDSMNLTARPPPFFLAGKLFASLHFLSPPSSWYPHPCTPLLKISWHLYIRFRIGKATSSLVHTSPPPCACLLQPTLPASVYAPVALVFFRFGVVVGRSIR